VTTNKFYYNCLNINMKKKLITLFLSISLIGCSSLDLSTTSPSDIETDRILALGLNHSDNLNQASKLADPILVNAVIKELNNRILEADIALKESENETKYTDLVKVINNNTDNKINFTGPELTSNKKFGLLADSDQHNYFLQGVKDKNTGFIQHQLHLSIKYNSEDRRNYNSASFCNKWDGCVNEEQVDIVLISSDASSCSNLVCNYKEIMELDLSNDFLRQNMEEGFSVRFNSKSFYKNKISIPSSYIKGYLNKAN